MIRWISRHISAKAAMVAGITVLAAIAVGVQRTLATALVNKPMVVIALSVLVLATLIFLVAFLGTIFRLPGFRTAHRRGSSTTRFVSRATVDEVAEAEEALAGGPAVSDELAARRLAALEAEAG